MAALIFPAVAVLVSYGVSSTKYGQKLAREVSAKLEKIVEGWKGNVANDQEAVEEQVEETDVMDQLQAGEPVHVINNAAEESGRMNHIWIAITVVILIAFAMISFYQIRKRRKRKDEENMLLQTLEDARNNLKQLQDEMR
jgi:hypothetical protein